MFTTSRWVAVVALVGLTGTTWAADVPKPPSSLEVSRVRDDVFRMRSGLIRLVNPDNPTETAKNKKSLEVFARWLVLTIAEPPYNGEPEPKDAPKAPPGTERTIAFLADELDRNCELVPPPGSTRISIAQTEYGEEFGKQIMAAADEILKNSARPIELINAVRFMAIASKMPCPTLATKFVEIINNTKHSDALKLYAFQGLRKLLEQSDVIDPAKHIISPRDVTKLAVVTDSLSNYILQQRKPIDARETAVIQFVRLEAVAALGRCREGVIRQNNNAVVARPAWSLARILSADPNITPPFTEMERAEAAMGFAQMKIDKEMNLDVGAYFVNQALTVYVQAMTADYTNVNKGLGLPRYPWKIHAARWSYALSAWRENAKAARSKHADIVQSLAEVAINDVLKEVERSADKATYSTNRLFATWPQTNPPKAWGEMKPAILFSDDPTTILPVPQASTLTTPKKNPPMPMMPPQPTKK